jgi:hypothetical protein
MSRSLCPPSRRGPRGSAGRAEAVDVGRHRVVRVAGLSTGVHRCVPLHELPPTQRSISAALEGEVGEVVGGEPKMLLRWVWPQHADDDVALEPRAKASRPAVHVRTLGRGDRAKVRPATGSTGLV